MPTYRVFGGTLESDLELAGLPRVDTTDVTWRFLQASQAPDPAGEVLVGQEIVSDQLTISLSRASGGELRLRYSAFGLGCFSISDRGATITWSAGDAPHRDALRWVLLGRVMATAMYEGGTVCLHGSAVAMHGRAVCFLAPKRHGKSTLAAALLQAGARILSDDVVPIDMGPPVSVQPGVPVLRLHEDSETALGLETVAPHRVGHDVGKARFDLGTTSQHLDAPHPLDAIYLLRPLGIDADHRDAAVRTPLDGMHALQRLVPQASVAPLLSAAESRLLLTRAAGMVRLVPVYELRFARDLARLPDVAHQILAWHGERRPVDE